LKERQKKKKKKGKTMKKKLKRLEKARPVKVETAEKGGLGCARRGLNPKKKGTR